MRCEAVRDMYLHHWTYSGAKDEAAWEPQTDLPARIPSGT
jgi:hypothetical protein